MLVKHLRDADRVPFATVVAIGRDMVGVSICCPKDKFNKKRGIAIAQGRAEKNHTVGLPNRKIEQWFSRAYLEQGGGSNTVDEIKDIPVNDFICGEVSKMVHRSRLYFKD